MIHKYENLLLSSGILNQRGNLLYIISRQHIEELTEAVQEHITLHYSKAKVQRNGTHNYDICIPHTKIQSSKLGSLHQILMEGLTNTTTWQDTIKSLLNASLTTAVGKKMTCLLS
jgi:hypothetical protein